jgi:hypothetical protein
LGLVLLVAGFLLIVVHVSPLIKPIRIFAKSINITGNNSYNYSYVYEFQTLKGDLFRLDIHTTNSSRLWVDEDSPNPSELWGDAQGGINYIPGSSGFNFNATVLIDGTGKCRFVIENAAETIHQRPTTSTPDVDFLGNDTFSGDFSLSGMPRYYPYLPPVGEALIVASCALMFIPVLSYFLFQAKRLGIRL